VLSGTGPFSSGDESTPRLALGDLNHDGRLDIVTANQGSRNVSVFLADGAGGYQAHAVSPIQIGVGPFHVMLADLDGDGHLDFVTRNLGSTITVGLGDGSGGFSPVSSVAVSGTNPVSFAAGDVDIDGNLDLVVASGQSSNVTVLLGNGAGGFTPAPGSPLALPSTPMAVRLGDGNEDGHLDLFVLPNLSNRLRVYHGDGSGAFAAGASVSTGATNQGTLELADMNHDGHLDAVAGGTNHAVILAGDGTGAFAVAHTHNYGTANIFDTALGDMNGDGWLDIGVTNLVTGGVSLAVWLNNGSGAFSLAGGSPFALTQSPRSISLGDLNSDGKLDLAAAVSPSSIVLLLNP
jgi:hypothetical protein